MAKKYNFYNIILGGQDGLVNVLGVVLGVASATNDAKVVIVAGIAATLAESISMGAVAYTSSKASKDYFLSKHKNHDNELKTLIKKISTSKRFLLRKILKHEFSNEEFKNPFKNSIIVFIASMIGSLIPLTAFFFMPVKTAIISSFVISTLALFTVGAIKAKTTMGNWKKSGLEIALIGILAAVVSYMIGILVGKLLL